MRTFTTIATLLVWATANSLFAQKGEALKVGFYYSDDGGSGKIVFTDGVNLIPGHNLKTENDVPKSIPATSLKPPGGGASPWGISALSEEIGASGAAMTASTYTAEVTDRFPIATISGNPNGVPLQGATNASITFDGLHPGEIYRVTVLAGRGNTWSGGTTTYAVEGLTLSAQVLAQFNAQAKAEGETVTAKADDGAWVLMVFETQATAPTLKLSASEGNGNLQAIVLEGLGAPAGTMIWQTAGNGSWTDPDNWSGYTNDAESRALLPDVNVATVTVDAQEAAAKEVFCSSAETVYTLNDLPDTIAVGSSGRLILADAEGHYGHTVTSGTTSISGESVICTGILAGTVNVNRSDDEEDSPRFGSLTLNGTAIDVTLAEGCTLAGDGQITGTLTVAPKSCIDATQGTLNIGTLAAQSLDFEDIALPSGTDRLERRATVIVCANRKQAGYLLTWTTCGEGVTFALSAEDGGALERRSDGLWYIPPEVSSYRLRLR